MQRIEYRADMAAETAREQAIISIYEQIALYGMMGINSCSELDYIVFIPSPEYWSRRVH